jgi:hypothetical protein
MPNTPVRHIRVPEDVWQAARAASAANGTTVAAVVNSKLREYISTSPGNSPGESKTSE